MRVRRWRGAEIIKTHIGGNGDLGCFEADVDAYLDRVRAGAFRVSRGRPAK